MKILGIEFAPVFIPITRRLQTFAVIAWPASLTILPMVLIILFLILLFTPLFWVTVALVTWYVFDIYIRDTSSRGGRRIPAVRRSVLWRLFRDYFPISLVKTTDLTAEKNYVLGYHPHGIIGCGALCNFASDATDFPNVFPDITPHLLTLKMNFQFPIYRDILLSHGCCDVSKESMTHILTRQGPGNAVVVVVGGAEEALNARPGWYDLTLKKRKGFVKMAIRTGASLVPVFSFGENDLFHQANNPSGSMLRGFQNAFKKTLGFSPPMFYGRGVFNYSFGMMPFRKPIHTVVGKPIDVEQSDNPEQEVVDKIHQRYMDELSQMFDDHKEKYGVDKDKKLNFI